MAKNVQGVIFLRNNNPYSSRELALTGIESKKSLVGDGQFILARYNATEGNDTVIKTLVGVKAGDGANGYLTIIDVEGGSADVDALRQEINAKLALEGKPEKYKLDEDGDVKIRPMSIQKAIIFIVLGIAGIIIGSNFVVDSASAIARALGVSDALIALTIVAFGTSLPELVTSVVAARKGECDIAIGNVVGSNIFNIGIVAGIPILLLGGVSDMTSFNYVDVAVMLLATLLLFVFTIRDRHVGKLEGAIFLLIFVTYYGYTITQALI